MVAPTPNPVAGGRYGRWLVLSSEPIKREKYLYFKLRCECGVEKEVEKNNFMKGKSVSCGCYNVEVTKITNKTHGMSKLPIYAIWNMMVQRCHVPTYRLYADYGGRGIKVCDEWRTFENFYRDMGDPPFEGASLERERNEKGYSKDNCRWATRIEQNRNKRNNHRYEYNGESLLLIEWAERTGINHATLSSRVNQYGWSIEKALTTPVQGS